MVWGNEEIYRITTHTHEQQLVKDILGSVRVRALGRCMHHSCPVDERWKSRWISSLCSGATLNNKGSSQGNPSQLSVVSYNPKLICSHSSVYIKATYVI